MNEGEIDTKAAESGEEVGVSAEAAERDYETEAREMGWRPPDEFPGDKKLFVSAEEWVKRGETLLPLIKADRDRYKRELSTLKRQMKQASEFFSKSEERAYTRALKEIEARHNDAVETGDVVAAKKAVGEMRALEAEMSEVKGALKVDDDDAPDPEAVRKSFVEWAEKSSWYQVDPERTRFADLIADTLGPAAEYKDGPQAWLAEIDRRVDRKFAAAKPNPVNPGGARAGPKGGKTFNDLPPEARAACDKWVKAGILKSREDYVKSYQWD